MLRNDYRRSLILLRSNASGYAGHVRLERRTLMGSMYFVVQSPEEGAGLQAVLIGRGRQGYYACGLGELRRDNRQQLSLSVSFDPRSICGRELEEYQLAAVTRENGEGGVVLFGNLNGHADIDWDCALAAVRALYAQAENLPEPIPPEPQEKMEAAADPPAKAEPAVTALPATEEAAEQKAAVLPEFPAARSAAGLLGADMNLPWPAEAEALKAYFRDAAALEIAPDDRYVYISVPMPEKSGYDSCTVGLRAENGRIAGVSYALSSLYSAEPPAGLEEYVWAGDNSRGWWVREVELTE